MHILDLSDPAQPVEIGAWSGEYIHDVYVRGDYAYAAGIYTSTMYIIDISDKTNPQTVTSWSYPGMAHACWLTEDGNYLISADETAGGNIKIWDIQDINNINMVSQWTHEGGESKSVHNVFVRDQYACQYTGEVYPKHLLTIDHVVPRSRGGMTTWDNIVTACRKCNIKKGNRTPSEANMTLIRKPKSPTIISYMHMSYQFRHDPSWKKYLYLN